MPCTLSMLAYGGLLTDDFFPTWRPKSALSDTPYPLRYLHQLLISYGFVTGIHFSNFQHSPFVMTVLLTIKPLVTISYHPTIKDT